MNVINPIPLTDALLIGSNVPENDAQEWSAGTSFDVDDDVMISLIVANVHKTYENLKAQSSGISADILDEPFNSLTSWTDGDTGVGGGVSEISPAGQLRLDTNISAAGNYIAKVSRIISSPPNTFSLEVRSYFDAIGNHADVDNFQIIYESATWRFNVRFSLDGLMIVKTGLGTTEVGTDIIKCNTTAAWQTWRFQVNKTTESTATVEVFLREEGALPVSQGTFDCDLELAGTDGQISLIQYGSTKDNMVSHIAHIKIGTGLSALDYTNDSPVGSTKWLEVDSTNRWKAFNSILGSQTEQVTKIEYIRYSGGGDSVALMNLVSDTVDIVEIDHDNNLVTNGTAWTGATGTTQPTGWDKVGSPSDFTIWFGLIRITSDAANEGISQTLAVTAGTEYQLIIGYYFNNSADVAQVKIGDVTHSTEILTTTDLNDSPDSNGLSFTNVFTTPAGCTSIKVSLMAKNSGDVVYFDNIILATTEYSETVTTGISKKTVVKTDIPAKTNGIITATINYSGTAKVGELIVGSKFYIGAGPLEEAQGGFANHSDFSENTFGEVELVPKSYSKKLSFDVDIDYADIDSIYDFLCEQKDTMMLYLGSETYGALQIYGFCKEPVITYHSTYCTMALETRGVI